ncbi:MAG: protein-L-isoaspartate(D-aspartate) O-methyltransferase [Candidatus Omnitrophica bacterium]|nr:protein-L-isoaspartate(D-aspartate) O-methyltransferase [Candidatus Omnitrophota bacterium]
MDYAQLRKIMVEEQIAARGINNQRVLDAFLKVERHKFIPKELEVNAYADFPLPIGEGQTISQPYIVALMTDTLGLTGEERVLEIGTGSGYQTAILAELAKEVYTVERLIDLSERAENALKEAGYTNIRIKSGDGTQGWPEFAPFDRIIVTAASPNIPKPLVAQLKENGRLILPLGESISQILTLVEKHNAKINTKQICGCVFVPLIGKYSTEAN